MIAVGTTTTRTLESVGACARRTHRRGAGATDLFIFPGFEFQIVRGLITNFHLPRSSLLMLVSAFAGASASSPRIRPRSHARYRFYSYGDAMLIL